MSPWTLVFYFFLYRISLSSADGVFADESTIFNEDIDPLQSTYLLDTTNPDLVSDVNFIVEDSDGFDILPNDLGSDLFASDTDLNSIVDTPLVADCTSIVNDYPLKKLRVRRETACRNPYSNPSLSLPTLDQVSASEARKGPFRPQSPGAKQLADMLIEFSVEVGLLLRTADWILKDCHLGETRVCSSDNGYEIQPEGNRGTYTLADSTDLTSSNTCIFPREPFCCQEWQDGVGRSCRRLIV